MWLPLFHSRGIVVARRCAHVHHPRHPGGGWPAKCQDGSSQEWRGILLPRPDFGCLIVYGPLTDFSDRWLDPCPPGGRHEKPRLAFFSSESLLWHTIFVLPTHGFPPRVPLLAIHSMPASMRLSSPNCLSTFSTTRLSVSERINHLSCQNTERSN